MYYDKLSQTGTMDAIRQAGQDSLIAYFTQPIALTTAAVIVLLYILWRGTRNQAILRKINAPGPKPWPFIGNALDFRKFNGVHLLLCDYIQKYGKVLAVTLGKKPSVVIADPDMLKQILVKDFWNFSNRAVSVKIPGPMGKSVFFARDNAWKRIRTTLTPTFSAKKMKGMVSMMEESCDRLIAKIEKVVDTGKWRVFYLKTIEVNACFVNLCNGTDMFPCQMEKRKFANMEHWTAGFRNDYKRTEKKERRSRM